MERSRRNSGMPVWVNPCGYVLEAAFQEQNGGYTPDMAGRVATLAQVARMSTDSYRDEFAKKKYSLSFETLHENWKDLSLEWLIRPAWLKVPIMPEDKALGVPVSAEYLKSQMNDINRSLPLMYKQLELMLAAMDSVAKGEYSAKSSDNMDALQENLSITRDKLRSVLCEFDTMLFMRQVAKLPSVDRGEVPPPKHDDTADLITAWLIFRDTINYLEYLEPFFRQMAEAGI